MANINNTMGLSDLLNSYKEADLAQSMVDINNKAAKSQNELDKALDAMLQGKGNYTEDTMNWLRDTLGLTATDKISANEQLALYKFLGLGKDNKKELMAKQLNELANTIGSPKGSTSSIQVTPARGFGVVSRK